MSHFFYYNTKRLQSQQLTLTRLYFRVCDLSGECGDASPYIDSLVEHDVILPLYSVCARVCVCVCVASGRPQVGLLLLLPSVISNDQWVAIVLCFEEMDGCALLQVLMRLSDSRMCTLQIIKYWWTETDNYCILRFYSWRLTSCANSWIQNMKMLWSRG